jgi:hypothetical protein
MSNRILAGAVAACSMRRAPRAARSRRGLGTEIGGADRGVGPDLRPACRSRSLRPWTSTVMRSASAEHRPPCRAPPSRIVILALEGPEELGHLHRAARTESGHGLVKDQQPGVACQGHAHFQLLFLAVAEGARGVFRLFGQVDPGEHRRQAAVHQRVVECLLPEAEMVTVLGEDSQGQVFSHAEVVEDGGDLEGAGQPTGGAAPGLHAADLLAVETDAARVRQQQAAELVNQGGLTGAVGADEGVDLALGHVERKVVGGQQRTVGLVQMPHLQDRFRHPRAPDRPTDRRRRDGRRGLR